MYPRGVWFAYVMLSFSGIMFVCFCFASFFVFMLSLKPQPFVRSNVLRYASAPTATCSYLTFVCVLFFSFIFLSFFVALETSVFPSILVPLPFSLCIVEYVVRCFPSGWRFFSILWPRDGFLASAFMREFNQSIN